MAARSLSFSKSVIDDFISKGFLLRKTPLHGNSVRADGFTLIEILVAVGIMTSIVALGATRYRDFARRQSLTSATKKIIDSISKAHNLALTGHKPSGCLNWGGILYDIDSSNNTYSLTAVCKGGTNILVEGPLPYPAGYDVTTTKASFSFLPVYGNTDLASDVVINVKSSNSTAESDITLFVSGQTEYTIVSY